jgi:hypothetical protein
MTDLALKRENEILRILADRYESEGYVFLAYPSQNLVPQFLKNYQPDAIALPSSDKGKHSVIIEIRTARSSESNRRLSEIAQLVSQQPNWKFQVFYSGEFGSRDVYGRPTRDAVFDLMEEARGLERAGFVNVALVMGWSALEASVRALRSDTDNSRIAMSPNAIVEWLATTGRVDSSNARSLRRLIDMRNGIVHGVPGVRVHPQDVFLLLKITGDVMANFEAMDR